MIQVGSMVNLFNLLPVSPLDGGRIVTVLSTKIWLIGLVLLTLFAFKTHSPILFLILVIGCVNGWNRMRESAENTIIQAELDALREAEATLKSILDPQKEWNELEELFPSHEANQRYIDTRENLRDFKRELFHTLSLEKKFYFPFLQDDQKFAAKRIDFRHHYTSLVLDGLTGSLSMLDGSTLQSVSDSLHNRKEALLAEQSRLKTYYVSSMKSKIVVLILFLALAGALTLFMNYALAILSHHPELLR